LTFYKKLCFSLTSILSRCDNNNHLLSWAGEEALRSLMSHATRQTRDEKPQASSAELRNLYNNDGNVQRQGTTQLSRKTEAHPKNNSLRPTPFP